VKEGSTVSVGGSRTLFEAGVIDLLRNGKYTFYDRYEEGLDPDGIKEVFRKSFFADPRCRHTVSTSLHDMCMPPLFVLMHDFLVLIINNLLILITQ
jgi:hypothetical protein